MKPKKIETQKNVDDLTQALAELRRICAEENYTLEILPRQDRSNSLILPYFLLVSQLFEMTISPNLTGLAADKPFLKC